MNYCTIEMDDCINLVGKNKGLGFSNRIGIRYYFENYDNIIFIISENTIGITGSYIIGMLESVMDLLPKNIDSFFDKIQFKVNNKEQIDYYLYSSLMFSINRLYLEKEVEYKI